MYRGWPSCVGVINMAKPTGEDIFKIQTWTQFNPNVSQFSISFHFNI